MEHTPFAKLRPYVAVPALLLGYLCLFLAAGSAWIGDWFLFFFFCLLFWIGKCIVVRLF